MKIKYTRYDLKRKKRDNFWFFIVVIVILALSLILGSIFSKMFMKGTSSKTSPNPSINEIPYVDKNESKSNDVKSSSEDKKSIDNNIKEINPSKGKKIKYVAVQEGMYQNESYVNESIKKLNEFGNPFIISEGNGKRILLGIYVEEQSEKIIKTLTDKKIENSKVVFEVKCEDVCDLQIVEIINAYIQVLNKLSEKNVKSIQTKDVKSWCASLQGAKDNDKNIKLLNELKDKINKLPNEITRDKASENYVFLYNLLKKLS